MAGEICMSITYGPIFRVFNTSRKVFFFLTSFYFSLFLVYPVNGQNIREHINQGNALYHEEKFDEALTRYQDALVDDPRSEVANFNQGDALYKIGKYDEAIEMPIFNRTSCRKVSNPIKRHLISIPAITMRNIIWNWPGRN
jgi:hypothetical protein